MIVFQQPVFWHNTTPLLKQWQDLVLTLGCAFTLRLCQFDILPMVTLYETAFGLSDEDLALAGKQYAELLASVAACLASRSAGCGAQPGRTTWLGTI